MGSKNNFAAMQKARRQAEMELMFQWVSQMWADAFVIVTGDKQIMGKDTFGPKRCEKVLRAVEETAQYIERAITKRDDADAVMVQVDRALGQRLGDKMMPWEERYEGWKGVKHGR
jgi:hypothetical protein